MQSSQAAAQYKMQRARHAAAAFARFFGLFFAHFYRYYYRFDRRQSPVFAQAC